MLERWKKAMDKGKLAGTFECINHEMLIAKIEDYDLTINR